MAERKELEEDRETSSGDTRPPPSPASSASSDTDSISSGSHHFAHEYTGDAPELILTPHISRASIRSAGKSLAHISLQKSRTSVATAATNTDPVFEVDFAEDDKSNPRLWPLWYKCCVIGAMSFGTTTVVLYSTSYTSAIPGLQSAFGISEITGVLGVTTYLIGMAVGSLILAPLSEMYGRRPIYFASLFLFMLLTLPAALARNIETILIVRFFGAFAASAMISNAPGSVNDVVDEEHRALAFSIWSIGPMNGPVIGPVCGGFVFEYLGWRWTNWVVTIVSGAAWVIVSSIPETYSPAILRKRAAKKRKETSDSRWWSRYDETASFWPLLKVNLKRPFTMTFTEPILMFWDVYIAIVYGILYLCFVAYPIVFGGLRHWSSGLQGLAFCGIGTGSLIVIFSEPLLRKMINSHRCDPATGRPPPEAMVSVVCIASVLLPAGELIFAWTCTPNVHWIAPIIGGIPFGMGNTGIFIYASNYLVHSYGIYAASALAGNAVLRSVLGATLPLAGPAMYASLGPQWAGTTLALLEVVCIPIPFVFYKFGDRIRMKSALIRSMQEDANRLERKRKRAEEKKMLRGRNGVGDDGEEKGEIEEENGGMLDLEKRAEAEVYEGAPMEGAVAMDEEIAEVEGRRRRDEGHKV